MVADRHLSLVGGDVDRERMSVADLVVLHGVLQQHLDRHGRKLVPESLGCQLDIEHQVLLITHFQQIDKGLDKGHLVAQGDGVRPIVLQRIAQHLRELAQVTPRLVGRLADQGIKRVQRVEEHVRVELAFQRLVLVNDILRAQLLVLDRHPLAFLVEMAQVAGSRDDARDQEIPQRMQVVVQHGVDGGQVGHLVQEDVAFPEQAVHEPGQGERSGQLSPSDLSLAVVEPEQSLVQVKQEQQREVGEGDLVEDIGPDNAGEKPSLLHHRGRERGLAGEVGQVHHLRRVDEERHHDRYGVHHQEVFVME